MGPKTYIYNSAPLSKELTKKNNVLKALENRHVVMREIVKGHSLIIKFLPEKNYFDVDYENLNIDTKEEVALLTMEANVNDEEYNLYKDFQKLKNFIGKGNVEFFVFGEFINETTGVQQYVKKDSENAFFVVTDIYLNDNWMCNDHLQSLCEKCNLQVAPILYNGKYNETAAKKLVESASVFNSDVKVHSIEVTTVVEDETKGDRLATIFYNPDFRPKSTNNKKNTSFYENIANNLIKKEFGETAKNNIIAMTRNKFSVFNEATKHNILAFAVNNAINIYLSQKIFTYTPTGNYKFVNFESEKEKVKKELRKQLPTYFVKAFGFK